MQPQLRILSPELIPQIIEEAFHLLMNPGIKVQLNEARDLLSEAGAQVDDVHRVLIEAGIDVRDGGKNDHMARIRVHSERIPDALRCLHREFFETETNQ